LTSPNRGLAFLDKHRGSFIFLSRSMGGKTGRGPRVTTFAARFMAGQAFVCLHIPSPLSSPVNHYGPPSAFCHPLTLLFAGVISVGGRCFEGRAPLPKLQKLILPLVGEGISRLPGFPLVVAGNKTNFPSFPFQKNTNDAVGGLVLKIQCLRLGHMPHWFCP